MVGVFKTVYTTLDLTALGLTLENFELLFSVVFILLVLLSFTFLLSTKRRGGTNEFLNAEIKTLKEDIRDSDNRIKTIEDEKAHIARQHEEALSKLKEAKEAILKMDSDYKLYKEGFQDDTDAFSAMDEEVKTYRIKLGELKKEKEDTVARHEMERKDFEEEIEELKKRIGSMEKEFEDKAKKREEVHKTRVEDIKTSAKESMLKLTNEKEKELEEIKNENENMKKQVKSLKNEIRVQEIEKL